MKVQTSGDKMDTQMKFNQRQAKEMQMHRIHMSNMCGREVTEMEACMDWTVVKPNSTHCMAQTYRAHHQVEGVK